jgi:hypothetical protein
VHRLLHWLQTLLPRSDTSTSYVTATTSTSIVFYVRIRTTDPLRQSEILTNVIQKRQSLASFGNQPPVLEATSHPYAIVISQDCDLEQDFRARKSETPVDKNAADKTIPNVLLLEALPVTELLSKVGGSDIRKRVRNNKDERYHVLQKIESADDAEGTGLDSLGVDFKRFFTIPTDELYLQLKSNAKRHACLASPYLEHLARRFADFQSRVALPADHKID